MQVHLTGAAIELQDKQSQSARESLSVREFHLLLLLVLHSKRHRWKHISSKTRFVEAHTVKQMHTSLNTNSGNAWKNYSESLKRESRCIREYFLFPPTPSSNLTKNIMYDICLVFLSSILKKPTLPFRSWKCNLHIHFFFSVYMKLRGVPCQSSSMAKTNLRLQRCKFGHLILNKT